MTARRDFLGFTGGAIASVLPAAARAKASSISANCSEGSAPHPDAALLIACAEYLRIQREFDAYYATLTGDMEEGDPGIAILDPLDALVDRIVALPALTPEGYAARGRCLAFHYLAHNAACQDDPDGAAEDRFRAANMRDLVRMEKGGVA